MKEFFIFGSDSAYGIGAERAGWADLLKQSLQAKMYGRVGIGSKYAVYNFAQPDTGIEFTRVIYADQLRFYGIGEKTAIFSAEDKHIDEKKWIKNFPSSLQEYEGLVSQILEGLKTYADKTIVVANTITRIPSTTELQPEKTIEHKSLLAKDRILMCNTSLIKLCREYGAICVDINPEEWLQEDRYFDGVHPNQAGHQFIFEKLWLAVEKLL